MYKINKLLLKIKYHIVSRSDNDNTVSYNDISKLSSDIGTVINTTPIGMPPYQNAELPIEWKELINLKTDTQDTLKSSQRIKIFKPSN